MAIIKSIKTENNELTGRVFNKIRDDILNGKVNERTLQRY